MDENGLIGLKKRNNISLNRLNGLLEDEWYKLLLISSVSRTLDDNPVI